MNTTTMRDQYVEAQCVVVGGGPSGIAAAITASRRGIKTVLVTDRPVLGGNSSKEIRVWLSGAEGGQNNLYYRETGLAEELRLENLNRNPEGNAEIWHLVLTDFVLAEPFLSLYLNTNIHEVSRDESGRISSVTGHQHGSENCISFAGQMFVDATGDGSLGDNAGVPFRVGREGRDVYNEELAPEVSDNITLGGTILFGAKPTDSEVEFKRPFWAHELSEEDMARRSISEPTGGGGFWYVEWGGEHDTIHENEKIRHELLRIVYGIWDYLKNSDTWRSRTRNLALEWVGTIPGKRESRRLEGHYTLTEADLLNQTQFEDAVATGGWSLDDHPPGGFFADGPGCTQIHPPGPYQIPLSTLVAKNVPNLFMAGRNASMSHVAMTSTRVMLTCIQMGEAVGAAAVLALEEKIDAEATLHGHHIKKIQNRLLERDHWIVGMKRDTSHDLAASATISSSSTLALNAVETAEIPEIVQLSVGHLQMFPVTSEKIDSLQILVEVERTTTLVYRLLKADENGNYLPDKIVSNGSVVIDRIKGTAWIILPIEATTEPGWHFLELRPNPSVGLHTRRYPNVGLILRKWAPNKFNRFSPWQRVSSSDRGDGKKTNRNLSLCIRVEPNQHPYSAVEAVGGYDRPHRQPNLWISAATSFEKPEWLEFSWDSPQYIGCITLTFNSDLDTDLRTIWMEHSMRTMPECVRDYRLVAVSQGKEKILAEVFGNYQRFVVHRFDPVVDVESVRLEIIATNGSPHAQVAGVHIFDAEHGPEKRWIDP